MYSHFSCQVSGCQAESNRKIYVAPTIFLCDDSSHRRCTVQTETDTGEKMKAVSKALNWLGLAVVAAAILGAFSFGALGVYLLVLLQS